MSEPSVLDLFTVPVRCCPDVPRRRDAIARTLWQTLKMCPGLGLSTST